MNFANREGQRVPEVSFRIRRDEQWIDVSTKEIFDARTVVVFALPGAFTPTCSSAHVPRYNALAQTLRRNGVDEIVCVSVNDTFVMNAWQKDQNADEITFIADGNGEFTEKMGMLVDKSELGFGKRSWRYSMLVRDGVIEKMFIEPEQPGDPYEVSDADTMLAYVNPQAEPPADVTLFSKPGCPFCADAKTLLHENGIQFEEILTGSQVTERSLRAVAGATSYPQVFVNGAHIGDSVALREWLQSRKAA